MFIVNVLPIVIINDFGLIDKSKVGVPKCRANLISLQHQNEPTEMNREYIHIDQLANGSVSLLIHGPCCDA